MEDSRTLGVAATRAAAPVGHAVGGDRIHPNPVGYAVMGESIDLAIFENISEWAPSEGGPLTGGEASHGA